MLWTVENTTFYYDSSLSRRRKLTIGAPAAAMSSGKTREEKRLVAAVERFQKLEKDRQRMQERGGAGKRSAVDMEPEGQGATRQMDPDAVKLVW